MTPIPLMRSDVDIQHGLVLDLETTGLNSQADQIIEIGLVEFIYAKDKKPQIVWSYGSLQDPGIPLSDEVVKITGLQNEDLAGREIDWELVRKAIGRASIVIAHNMEFDRAFLQASGEISGLNPHWACSMRHVDWRAHGCSTLSLNYLAADHGFLNPFAHRAIFDCATTFRLVAPYLDEMIERSHEAEFLIRAVNSPFETKDVLKKRGYRWNPDERCWSRVVSERDLEDERGFLSEHVYRGRGAHQEQQL